jgi:hypothetical protein
MSLKLLVDGDSLARTPPQGRLSPQRLDSALSSLGALLAEDPVRVLVVISPAFAEALGVTQLARFERFGRGSLIVAPGDLHFRDFLVRAANDGAAIIVSNNAFTRQIDYFPWLAESGSGRHVLARQSTTSTSWNFVEARPTGGSRRSLGELLGRTPLAGSSFPPPDLSGGLSARSETVKGLAEKTRARQAVDDWLSDRRGSEDHQAGDPKDAAVETAPSASSSPSKPRRSRPASKAPSKAPRKPRANKQRTEEP